MTGDDVPRDLCSSLRRTLLLSSVVLALAGCVATDGQIALEPGRIGATSTAGAETWMLPSPVTGFLMPARVYRPTGDGPFPLVIVSHGSQQDANARRRMPFPTYPHLTEWFVARGHVVVVPERPGHGSGGRYLEDQGGCDDADYVRSANGAADSIAAAVGYMRRQDFVQPQGIIIAGHSAGGLGSLAYAARGPAGVWGVVNFAGGRGGHHLNRPGTIARRADWSMPQPVSARRRGCRRSGSTRRTTAARLRPPSREPFRTAMSGRDALCAQTRFRSNFPKVPPSP